MLSLRNLTKTFPGRGASPDVNVIKGISVDVKKGEFFTLLGPSGCGKTTTLQCIAGLETPTSGTIEMNGKPVYCSTRRILVPANKRNLGMVFQSYAIWPHLTVFDNVAFPLVHGQHRSRADDVKRRVMKALDLVKLADFADRPSPHLSGGQQQRVALARALVHEPALLLLDEPLSNLDAKLRDDMRVEIRQLVKALGITTIFVTHDQLEAMSMSDTILLLQSGTIVQKGSPRDVYLRPESAFAADFMGRSNLIPGRLGLSGASVVTGFGEVHCVAAPDLRSGDEAFLVVRANSLRIGSKASPGSGGQYTFDARIVSQSFLGDVTEAEIMIGDIPMRVSFEPYEVFGDGDEITVEFLPDRCVAVARVPMQSGAYAR